eukprot:TRINITY_DN49466_c0_g1_i1.p1 TRINITY_DN49466_c0_g1~~TRINITY_DN49466_c0_g1_i1.p1  ORF type:complete len:287 (+),score=40.03 TRINITY_DN49466_c0_g1_i1:114-974(+)
MVWCVPVTQFCCGCSVSFGVKLTLIVHFMMCIAVVAQAAAMLSLQSDALSLIGDRTLAGITVRAFWCLAGLPIILMAFWAVFQRTEGLVRLYFGYAFLTFLVDMIFIIKSLFFSGGCEHLPKGLADQGKAFGCGVARGFAFSSFVMLSGIQLYLLYVVWSFCEDVSEGCASDFSDLAKDSMGRSISAKMLRRGKHDEASGKDGYSSMLGVAHSPESVEGGLWSEVKASLGLGPAPLGGFAVGGDVDGGEYSGGYGAAGASGIGGSQRIFGSGFHELRFPPPPSNGY